MNARAIIEHALSDIVMPKALRQRLVDHLEPVIVETLVRGRRLARAQSMRSRKSAAVRTSVHV
jgi:hypothetical protein